MDLLNGASYDVCLETQSEQQAHLNKSSSMGEYACTRNLCARDVLGRCTWLEGCMLGSCELPARELHAREQCLC